MPQDFPLRYSTDYPDPQDTKEKLNDAALSAAQTNDPSILVKAIGDEYQAAIERSGIHEKQGDFLSHAARLHAENAADAAKGAARGLARYQTNERSIKADEFADAATHRIEQMEDFLHDVAGSAKLRQDAQETFRTTLHGPGRIDPDSCSHFEVRDLVQHLAGYPEPTEPYTRTRARAAAEQFSAETIGHAAQHAMYLAQEYQNLGQPHQREQAVQDIALCAAISAAAGYIARHPESITPDATPQE